MKGEATVGTVGKCSAAVTACQMRRNALGAATANNYYPPHRDIEGDLPPLPNRLSGSALCFGMRKAEKKTERPEKINEQQ